LLSAGALEGAVAAGIPTVASLHDFWFFCPRLTLLRSNGERCEGEATAADCAWCLMAERRRYQLLDLAASRLGRPAGRVRASVAPSGCP